MTDTPGLLFHPRVATLLAAEICVAPEGIRADADMDDDLGADEVDLAAFWVEVEHEFAVVVTDDEAAACDTIAEVCALLHAKGARP